MRIIVNRAVLAALAISAALTVSACGSTASGGAPSSGAAAGTGDQSPIPVVTSTNVWGDIARQVGGDQVAVTPLIVDPAADPHSFEPNAQAQLALSKAALVVENGGGYDDFMQTLTHAAGVTAPVITAVDLFGADADGAAPSGTAGQGPSNEHVWYDFPTVDAVATKIAGELTAIAPAQAAFFQANLSAFTDKLAGLTTKLGAIKAAHDGAPVAITEPVPLYLTQAAGFGQQDAAGVQCGDRGRHRRPADGALGHPGLVHRPTGRRPRLQRTDVVAGDREAAGRGQGQRHPDGRGHRDPAGG